jgi:hypothetical protein
MGVKVSREQIKYWAYGFLGGDIDCIGVGM